MLYDHQCQMTSPVSAGLALTLEDRICKLLSLPNLLTCRSERDGGEEGEKRSWSVTRGPLLFRGELPEVRILCQGHDQCRLTTYIRERSRCQDWLPSAKCCDVFCSADITGIECLGLSQQMWSHTQANTDFSLCLLFQDYSLVLPEQTDKSHHRYTAIKEFKVNLKEPVAMANRTEC